MPSSTGSRSRPRADPPAPRTMGILRRESLPAGMFSGPLKATGLKPAGAPARAPQRAWRWWAARPVLAASCIYAVLSIVFVGQGLLPGRTLSSSDMLWSTAPVDGRRAAGGALGRRQLRAGRRDHGVPALLRAHARTCCPTSRSGTRTSWAGRPFLANAQSAIFSPFSVPAYVLPFWKSLAVIAILKLFVAALRHLPARARRSGCASAALCWPVLVFALRDLLRRLAGLAADQHLPAAALAAAADRAGDPKARAAARRRAGGARGAHLLRRPSRDELPRARGDRGVLRLPAAAPVAARPARPSALVCARRWPSGWRWPAAPRSRR